MGRPIDPDSARQRRARGELGYGKRLRSEVTAEITEQDFEFLQTIATLNGGADVPAPLAEIGNVYGMTKQGAYYRVKRLRARGWLEENDARERKTCGVRLTHNGKLLIETGLGAGMAE
jgi:hypothetical protein